MSRYFKALGTLALVGVLTACGGGGGSAGTVGTSSGSSGNPSDSSSGSGTGTDSGTSGTATPTAASFIYQLSKNSLSNSGSDSSLLTMTALDANNNPVSGVPVTVALDSGVYTPTAGATGSNGQASGTITIGANKANRNINATIKVGAQSATAVIPVTGSQITLSPVPATPMPGASVQVTVKVTDVNGNGIPSVPVQLSGSLGLTGTATTDVSGNATASLGAAPATPGTYSVDASALGVQASRAVQVVSSTGGGIPDAVGPISASFISIVPNTIAPNASGSTTSRAALRASFSTAGNQAIQNVRVRFEIVAPGLGSGEQVSTGANTVYSDVNGNAIADYIAGTRSSPTDGVVIRACYGLTDADIANGACANSVTGTLTVASQPLSITLGDNNLLQRGNNSLTYIKMFDVAVADSAGNAVPNAVVSASVDITHYGKGGYSYMGSLPGGGTATYQVLGDAAATLQDTYIAPFSTFGLHDLDPNATPSPTAGRVWCLNEDTNRNGSLDTGEDISSDGALEPRKADVILSFTGSNTTGANGRMTIQVEYPQNVATWLSYTVKVTTSVAGSEGSVSKSYVTSFIEGDDKNGSFLSPPYGANSCSSPN